MSVDRRRTQPIMAWWCECGTRCEAYRQCPHCGRWPAPEPEPEGGDWWDPDDEGLCIWAAYQPKGAANFAASLVDLSGNGNNAGDPGGAATPTWDAVNGWKFDGIAQYLTTTFVAALDGSQSILIQFTNVGNTGVIAGSFNGGPNERYQITPDEAPNTVSYFNGGGIVQAPRLLAGNLGIAGNQGYRNGLADGGAIPGWLAANAMPVWIGCLNAGGCALPCACRVQALAIYDCTLTAPQVLAVAAAMALV